MLPIALNHMVAPDMRWEVFLDLARDLGCVGIEFRNDLASPLFDGADPALVGAAARDRGLRILALAEVKAFDNWTDATAEAAQNLAAIAQAAGAEAISLIPRNDGLGLEKAERLANLRTALREVAPILKAHDLIGLIEPLGFETCALRSKAEVVEMIDGLGLADRFRLVHDTFHHHLAGGGRIFPEHTGLVHVSGVTAPVLSTKEMQDTNRVLVDETDRLGNLAQIAALRDGGYAGPVSMEAFSPDVHALADPATALARSFEFIRSQLKAEVA